MITRATFVASTAAVGAAVMAAVFWKQLDAERLRTAQLQERISELENRPPAAPAPAPQIVLGTLRDASASPPAPAEAVPLPVAPPPPPITERLNVVTATAAATSLMSDPDYCIAQKATMRARMVQTYPDAGKVLRLSASQSTALTELLLKHQESDMPCASERAGDQPRLMGKARDDAQQAEIEALLGPAKYQEFKDYLPTRETRLNVNRLRDAVSTTDTPLTDQQASTLLSNALTENKRFRQEADALAPPTDMRSNLDYQEARLKLTEESQARLIAGAQSVLTPQQMAVMKNAMTAVNSRQRAMLRAQRAQLEASAGQQTQMPGLPVQVIPR